MSSKRFLVAEILKLAGVDEPRIVAAIAGLADAKFEFGPSSVEFKENRVCCRLEFSVNGKPTQALIALEGEAVGQIDQFFEAFGLKTPAAPVIMQSSPSPTPTPGEVSPAPPPVEFLAPRQA